LSDAEICNAIRSYEKRKDLAEWQCSVKKTPRLNRLSKLSSSNVKTVALIKAPENESEN